MHTDGGNIFEIFLLHVCISSFEKIQILVILPKNAISLGIYQKLV